MSKKGVSLGLVKALVSKATGADPAVIEQAVSDWLDDHPEATTTVADGSITEAKLASSVAQKVNLVSSLSDEIADNTLPVYETTTGTLKSTGEVTTSTSVLKKYYISEQIKKIYLSGTINTNPLTPPTCFLWCVSDGVMVSHVDITSRPQTWTNYEITVPDGTTEIWAHGNATITYDISEMPTVAKRLVTLEAKNEKLDAIPQILTNDLYAYESGSGLLRGNGTVSTSETATYKKYAIPDSLDKIYISGNVNLNVLDPAYSVLWFVANGAMLANGSVDVTVRPQAWNNSELTIPTGTSEIWAYSNISIKYPVNENYNLAPRVLSIEAQADQANDFIRNPKLFNGAFTWAWRVFGLRVLADAQGCYFIPFNAVGLGISRMNGMYGDDYIADQIHSLPLGAYNTGDGIWSYLKNIPCWHTSIPETRQAIDGTQWQGKKWYAYGTSLTLGASGGNYVTNVANASGLIATNKGIGGGALVSNRNIYNALLDMTDGKLEADLITIEVGANDHGPLGDPWSTNTNEFFGALNHCIKAMFDAGVQAQIVIMASYPIRYNSLDPTEKYDVDKLYNN